MTTDLEDRLGERLGEPVQEHVARRRADGKSWENIAFGLRTATGISVSVRTLTGWARRWEQEAGRTPELV